MQNMSMLHCIDFFPSPLLPKSVTRVTAVNCNDGSWPDQQGNKSGFSVLLKGTLTSGKKMPKI